MILSFLVQGEILDFRVDDDRSAWMRARLTNNTWIPFREAIEMSKQGGKSAEITQKIILCLPTLDDVEWYIRDEFAKLGMQFMRKA